MSSGEGEKSRIYRQPTAVKLETQYTDKRKNSLGHDRLPYCTALSCTGDPIDGNFSFCYNRRRALEYAARDKDARGLLPKAHSPSNTCLLLSGDDIFFGTGGPPHESPLR